MITTRVFFGLATLSLVVTACLSTGTGPPTVHPAGPLEVRVGNSVDFNVTGLPAGGVVWSVDGVIGGGPATGTISGLGLYQAPSRRLRIDPVEIRATSGADQTVFATATVNLTAPGTLYGMGIGISVVPDMDQAEGILIGARMFTITGTPYFDRYNDMAFSPSRDLAFVALFDPPSPVFRINEISTANVEVAATAFETAGYEWPTGMAYDEERDILYVSALGALLAYHGASTAPAGKAPDRIINGPDTAWLFGSMFTSLNFVAATGQLLATNSLGRTGVFDLVHLKNGNDAHDRTVELDIPDLPASYGAVHDPITDDFYLTVAGDPVGVYVIENITEVEGFRLPARSLGGPLNAFTQATRISYDPLNDRLAVIDYVSHQLHNILVYDQASHLNGDVAADRVIENLNYFDFGGIYLDPTQ